MFKAIRVVLGWFAYAVGIFYLPLDVSDRADAMDRWERLAAMVSQSSLLVILCGVLLVWVSWIEYRPAIMDRLGRGGISVGKKYDMPREKFGNYLYRGMASVRWGLVLENARPCVRVVRRFADDGPLVLNHGNPLFLPWASHGESEIRVASTEIFGLLKYEVATGTLGIHSATNLPSFPESTALEHGKYELALEVVHSRGVYRKRVRFTWDGDPRNLHLKTKL